MTRDEVFRVLLEVLNTRFSPPPDLRYSRSLDEVLSGIHTVVRHESGRVIARINDNWRRIPRDVLVKEEKLELRPDMYGRMSNREENELSLIAITPLKMTIERLVRLVKQLPEGETRSCVLVELDGELAHLVAEEANFRRRNVIGG